MVRSHKQKWRDGARGVLVSAAVMLLSVGLTGCGGLDSEPAVVVTEADGTGRPTVAEADAMVRDFKACWEEAGVGMEVSYNNEEGITETEPSFPPDSEYDGDPRELEERCWLIVAALDPGRNLSPEEVAVREKTSLEQQKCLADKGFVGIVDPETGALEVTTDDQPEGFDFEELVEAEQECYEAFPLEED